MQQTLNLIKNIIHHLENQKKFHSIQEIKCALNILGLKIDPAKVIVVSGTNGKGTTCATLQTLLVSAGKNIGFFSSPHLIKINERIKFNCKDISDDDFCEVFNAINCSATQQFSYFEYLTLMAAYYFFQIKHADFAIFEVGLGGSFDATNAVPHSLCAITKLGIDHENTLGSTLTKIAINKFGIISENNTVFHTQFPSVEVEKLSQEIAWKKSAVFVKAHPYRCKVDSTNKYPVFWIQTKFGNFKMNLQGQRAAENTALAITIFDHLVKNHKQFLPNIKNVNWPGRMEKIVYKNRDIFLSGDHNPQGIQSLLEILQFYKFEKVCFIVGICNDKNHCEMLEKLTNFKNSFLYLTETPERTLLIKNYDKKFLKLSKFASSNHIETLDKAISDSNKNDIIVVTGSLYLVGMFKSHFSNGCVLSYTFNKL